MNLGFQRLRPDTIKIMKKRNTQKHFKNLWLNHSATLPNLKCLFSFQARQQAGPTKYVYSTRSGSKSFDEIDDILSERPKGKPGCAANRKKNRRTLSSGADYLHHAAALRLHQSSLVKKNVAEKDEPMDISTHSLLLDMSVSNISFYRWNTFPIL